jgi:D-2-hydroxyacid dehydrogenase (NADP+)
MHKSIKEESMILIAQGLKTIDQKNLTEKLGENVIVRNNMDAAIPDLQQAEILVGLGHRLNALTPEVLQACKELKWIHITTAGVDTIPFEAIKGKGIMVSNSSGIHRTQIAEQVLGMMISFTRGLFFNAQNQLQKTWNQVYPLDELYGKTICIVGAGRIGQELARKAKVFDMHVIGIKSNPLPLDHFDRVLGLDQMMGAFEKSDFVINLLPLTPATTKLYGKEEFAAMKDTTIFLNFGRGPSVDEEALIQALQNKTISGAGLDVFATEPLPVESPLWSMPNVIISPHNAGGLERLEDRMIETFFINYKAYREGAPLPNQVDLNRRY